LAEVVLQLAILRRPEGWLMAFKSTQTTNALLPYDENPQWRDIFEKLSQAIGPANAYSWFGHCRFVRLQSDSLELSHWNSFSAAESLRKHGAHLAKAANVSMIRMNRSGGFQPVCVTNSVSHRSGFETYCRARAA
jgi:hypothetical protein